MSTEANMSSKTNAVIATRKSIATGWSQVTLKQAHPVTGKVTEVIVTIKDDAIDVTKIINDVVVK